jgi:hypothetical protein
MTCEAVCNTVPSPTFLTLLDERRGQRGTQEGCEPGLVRVGQSDRERGRWCFSAGMACRSAVASWIGETGDAAPYARGSREAASWALARRRSSTTWSHGLACGVSPPALREASAGGASTSGHSFCSCLREMATSRSTSSWTRASASVADVAPAPSSGALLQQSPTMRPMRREAVVPPVPECTPLEVAFLVGPRRASQFQRFLAWMCPSRALDTAQAGVEAYLLATRSAVWRMPPVPQADPLPI